MSVCVESRKGDSVEPIPERGSRGPAQDQKPPDAAGECCAARPAPSLPILTSDLGGDTVPFALRGRRMRRAGEVSRGTNRGAFFLRCCEPARGLRLPTGGRKQPFRNPGFGWRISPRGTMSRSPWSGPRDLGGAWGYTLRVGVGPPPWAQTITVPGAL